MLREIIKSYLIGNTDVDPQSFERPDLLVSELDLDSLGLIEMLFEIEDRYGLQIDQPMRFLPMTFNEMVSEIEVAVRQQHNGEIPVIPTSIPAA